MNPNPIGKLGKTLLYLVLNNMKLLELCYFCY